MPLYVLPICPTFYFLFCFLLITYLEITHLWFHTLKSGLERINIDMFLPNLTSFHRFRLLEFFLTSNIFIEGLLHFGHVQTQNQNIEGGFKCYSYKIKCRTQKIASVCILEKQTFVGLCRSITTWARRGRLSKIYLFVSTFRVKMSKYVRVGRWSKMGKIIST